MKIFYISLLLVFSTCFFSCDSLSAPNNSISEKTAEQDNPAQVNGATNTGKTRAASSFDTDTARNSSVDSKEDDKINALFQRHGITNKELQKNLISGRQNKISLPAPILDYSQPPKEKLGFVKKPELA